MSVVLHLSDLHLLGDPREQEGILPSLIAAIGKERVRRGRPFDLIAITGDVFDSALCSHEDAIRELHALHANIVKAIGARVPSVILPGNHDRRAMGFFGPHRDSLFRALRERASDDMLVHGTETPFLSKVVPPSFHRQPFWVIAYDSTYLPVGLMSAGGVVRRDDLLHAAAEIGTREPDWPLLFLLHHHLIPIPLTDLGAIETHRTHPLVHWGLSRLLPRIVAHADREELTMTALGAGTALSTLHQMNRAVLVLHGHKHYAHARKLEATEAGQGDVLLVSAGSAGVAQRWNPLTPRDTARLWPSFNVIELDGSAITVEAVSFGWKGRSAGEVAYRPLVWAEREGPRWRLQPVGGGETSAGPQLRLNRSEVVLRRSARFGGHRWDADCVRTVVPNGRAPRRYVETIDGAEGASLVRGEDEFATPFELPLELAELPPDQGPPRDPRVADMHEARSTRYSLRGAFYRTIGESTRWLGAAASPFASVGLMNRYRSSQATLVVEGLGGATGAAFGSVTDLGTGTEKPIHLERCDARVVIDLPNCPPRTLLRVYWPLLTSPEP